MTTQTDFEKAVTQPWKVYAAPEDVLKDDKLSTAEKRRILESWELDARELAVAEEENMGGGETNKLDRVVKALNALPATEEERPRGPATMHGSQPAPSSADHEHEGPQLSGKEARQGEIVLKTPKRRAVFIGGLVLAVILGLVIYSLAGGMPG